MPVPSEAWLRFGDLSSDGSLFAEQSAAALYLILDWLDSKNLFTPSGRKRIEQRTPDRWKSLGIYRQDVTAEGQSFLDRLFVGLFPMDVRMVVLMRDMKGAQDGFVLNVKLNDAWSAFTGDKYRDLKAGLQEAQSQDNDFELCDQVAVIIYDCQWLFPETKRALADQWVVRAVWGATGIIGNGGFEYLFSHELDEDPDLLRTLAAFKQIDCPEALEAMEGAYRLFQGGKPPSVREKRITEYEQVPESTRRAISIAFFDVSNSNAIERALATFIRNRPESFRVK